MGVKRLDPKTVADLYYQFEAEWERLATEVRVRWPFRAHDYPKGPSPRREEYIRRRFAELVESSRWELHSP